MPLNTHYTFKKVNSNDKVGNSIENGTFHNLKDLLIITFWFKQSLLKFETCVKSHIQNGKDFQR